MAKKIQKKVDKNDVAKQKADEIFTDVMTMSKPAQKKETPKSVDKKSKNENSWLEDQVQTLNDEVQRLEDALIQAKEDYQKLFNEKGGVGAPAQSDSDMTKSIKNIFEELRVNYEGLNSTRTRYTDAKIKLLLDRFLKAFPFLLEGKKVKR